MDSKYNMFDLFTASFIHTKKILFGENRKKIWLYFVYTLILSGVLFGIEPDMVRICKIYINMFKDMLKDALCSFNTCSLISCDFPLDNLLSITDDFLKTISNIVQNPDIEKYINNFITVLGIFLLISVLLIFFCIFRGKLMLIYSLSTNKEDAYNWRKLWTRFSQSGDYCSLIFSFIFCICLSFSWLIGHFCIYPMLDKVVNNFKDTFTLEIVSKNFVSMFLNILSFSICCLFILSLFYAFFVLYIYLVLPIMAKKDEKIKFFEDYKIFWNSLKKDFWKKILYIICAGIIIFVTSSLFRIAFAGVQGVINIIFSFIDLFINSPYSSLVAYGIFYLVIYLPVILFLNVPAGVYYTSLQIMLFSYIFPEHALLKPVINDNGKVIGTECLL